MFEITWTLGDDQWERANATRAAHSPGSSYDDSRSALYHLLCGDFEIRSETGELYGQGGINIPLLDFATFAARTLEQGSADQVSFDQLDDDRHIHFDFSNPRVRIWADDSERELEAPREEVISALRQFVVSLTRDIDMRAPRLFDWRSLALLVPYRSA